MKYKQEAEERKLVSKVYDVFEEFRSAYAAEWIRLDLNERLYTGTHWAPPEQPNEPQPTTNVIQSSVENLAADLMDNYPEAIIRPESPNDAEIAKVVDALIKQNHDAADYKREYKKLAHDLLVSGYCVQEVGYDTLKNSGIGAAFIRYVDNRNVLFDPQVTDIQEGRAVIKIEPKTIKSLEQKYPQLKGQFTTDEYTLLQDKHIAYDQTLSVLQLEYWWREFDTETNVYRIHMCKFAGHKLLEDSRAEKPEGYFRHGQYPFVVTPLFTRKGSALGYGIADMFGSQEEYADKLDQIVLKNAYMAKSNKLLIAKQSGFNVDDLRDWSKEVHEGQNIQGIQWFPTPALPAYIVQQPSLIRQNIKEESGANDFSRGNTNSGVTAASAIAALQEMSSKRSRMIAGQMHSAYKDAVRMEIEVEREYNILPREVLLTEDGQQRVATFDSALVNRVSQTGVEVPIEFYISIKVQRENKWSVMSHNELMLQMVQLQVLPPQLAVELLEFEGKEQVLAKVNQYQQQMMQQQAQQPTEEEIAAAENQAIDQALQQVPSPEQALV